MKRSANNEQPPPGATTTPRGRRAMLLLTLLALLSVFVPAPEMVPDLVIFLGRFHPPIVHAPIGFIAALLILELVAVLTRTGCRTGIRALLWVTAVSAVLAVVLGTLLALSGGYDARLLDWHRWGGVATAILSAWMVYFYGKPSAGAPPAAVRAAYWVCLLLASATVAASGHFGGSLTHGADYLTAYLPATLGGAADMPHATGEADRESIAVYPRVIRPLLAARCASCHNPQKAQGGLQVHRYATLLAGGKSGPAIVPGVPPDSLLLTRIGLPDDDKERMPPTGHDPVTKVEREILAWWVANGAQDAGPIPAAGNLSGPARGWLEEALGIPVGEPALEMLSWGAVERAAVGLQEMPSVLLRRISQETAGLDVRVLADTSTNQDAVVEVLLPIRANIVNFSAVQAHITDAALVHIATFRNLEILELAETAITDNGIEALSTLSHLRELNLFGTAVTEQALDTLGRLPALRRLHVWRTDISQASVDAWLTTHHSATRKQHLEAQLEDLHRELARLELQVTGASPTSSVTTGITATVSGEAE